jgi:hypothetical protein
VLFTSTPQPSQSRSDGHHDRGRHGRNRDPLYFTGKISGIRSLACCILSLPGWSLRYLPAAGGSLSSPKETVSKPRNPTHGSGGNLQTQPARLEHGPSVNPTHGSGWMVQVQPFPAEFRRLQRNLNNPPTPVGGIRSSRPAPRCGPYLKHPPTAVGGISGF